MTGQALLRWWTLRGRIVWLWSTDNLYSSPAQLEVTFTTFLIWLWWLIQLSCTARDNLHHLSHLAVMASTSLLNRSAFSQCVLAVSTVTVVLSYLNRSVFSHSVLVVSHSLSLVLSLLNRWRPAVSQCALAVSAVTVVLSHLNRWTPAISQCALAVSAVTVVLSHLNRWTPVFSHCALVVSVVTVVLSHLNRSAFSHCALAVSVVTVVLSHLNRSAFSHCAMAASQRPASAPRPQRVWRNALHPAHLHRVPGRVPVHRHFREGRLLRFGHPHSVR